MGGTIEPQEMLSFPGYSSFEDIYETVPETVFRAYSTSLNKTVCLKRITFAFIIMIDILLFTVVQVH